MRGHLHCQVLSEEQEHTSYKEYKHKLKTLWFEEHV